MRVWMVALDDELEDERKKPELTKSLKSALNGEMASLDCTEENKREYIHWANFLVS